MEKRNSSPTAFIIFFSIFLLGCISKIAKGKGGMYETITNEIKTYEVTTKIIKSETNKKEKTAVVTVF